MEKKLQKKHKNYQSIQAKLAKVQKSAKAREKEVAKKIQAEQ